MCPKMNHTKSKVSTGAPRSRFEQFKSKVTELHRVTIFAIILYLIFVVVFFCANILTCAWHFTMHRAKPSKTSNDDFPFETITAMGR
jgi:hypothetical protein